MNKLSVVILAGGAAHRSAGPRALLPVAGIPLVGHALRLAERLRPKSITIVGGDGCDELSVLVGSRARVVAQPENNGSGHAVGLAIEATGLEDGGLLVTYADRVFLKEETLRLLLGASRGGAVASLLSVFVDRPMGYARIIRDEEGRVVRASGDCSFARPEEAQIREVVAGAYWFDVKALRAALLQPATVDFKYNLVDCLHPIVLAGGRIVAIPLPDPSEASGVYSLEDAQRAETRLSLAYPDPYQKAGRAPAERPQRV